MKKGYIIHETSNGRYFICRILNEYESEEDAKRDLVKLLSKSLTEEELIERFRKNK